MISIYDLLVGDIINIKVGEILPVDGILFSGTMILMDESSVTGESDLIKKRPASRSDPRSPRLDSSFLISGSKVMDGVG